MIDYGSISGYLPATSVGLSSIIFTAQHSGSWSKHQILLEPLDETLGSQLLLRQVGLAQIDADHPDRLRAKEVSKFSAGSPLLINQAAGLMKLSNCDMKTLVQTSRDSTVLLGAGNIGANWRYERAPSTMFDPTLERLSANASNLLMMLAFMNPDHVEEEIFLHEQHTEDSKIPRFGQKAE